MTLELTCRCGKPHAVTRDDLLRLPPATYRLCLACRETERATPRVPATAVWSLTVERCPFCGTRHHHGGNDGPEPSYGARASHCITGAGGTYILVAASPDTSETKDVA